MKICSGSPLFSLDPRKDPNSDEENAMETSFELQLSA